jgi:hypothetical protein
MVVVVMMTMARVSWTAQVSKGIDRRARRSSGSGVVDRGETGEQANSVGPPRCQYRDCRLWDGDAAGRQKPENAKQTINGWARLNKTGNNKRREGVTTRVGCFFWGGERGTTGVRVPNLNWGESDLVAAGGAQGSCNHHQTGIFEMGPQRTRTARKVTVHAGQGPDRLPSASSLLLSARSPCWAVLGFCLAGREGWRRGSRGMEGVRARLLDRLSRKAPYPGGDWRRLWPEMGSVAGLRRERNS